MHRITVDSTIIAALIAIIAALVGWIANMVRGYVSGKKENAKIKKKVLFYLLDIRYSLKRISSDPGSPIPIDILQKKLAQFGMKENDFGFKLLWNSMHHLFNGQLKNQLGEINKAYRLAINELAPIDPTRAYRLSGHLEKLNSSECLDSIPMLNVAEGHLVKQVVTSKLDQLVVDNLLEIFAEEISSLADSTSKKLSREVSSINSSVDKMETPKESEIQKIEATIDDYLNDVFGKLAALKQAGDIDNLLASIPPEVLTQFIPSVAK